MKQPSPTKGVVESYARTFASFRDIAEQTRASARTRLVWFVAIAAFAILNGKELWDSVANASFSGVPLVALAAPWALAALLSLVGHFLVDEAGARDNTYYVVKLTAIDLHLESIAAGRENPSNMIHIFDDTHKDLVKPRADANRWTNAARWFERLAFFTLVIGFVWSLAGPFVLSSCAK